MNIGNDMIICGTFAKDRLKLPTNPDKVHHRIGGSAHYASLAARLCDRVIPFMAHGHDLDCKQVSGLNEVNIDLSQVLHFKDKPSFNWFGEYSEDLSSVETLELELGVYQDIEKLTFEYKDPHVGVLFLANCDPDLQFQVYQSCKEKAKVVAMDTMSHWIATKKPQVERMIQECDIVFMNEQELLELTGASNILEAKEDIEEWGVPYVVIKRGEHGAMLLAEDKIHKIQAFPCENVQDTTGAGDSFAGAMLSYCTHQGQWDWEIVCEASLWGALVASYTISGIGSEVLAQIDLKEALSRLVQ